MLKQGETIGSDTLGLKGFGLIPTCPLKVIMQAVVGLRRKSKA